MTEQKWLKSSSPDAMLDYHLVKSEKRRLRLLAVACVRGLWPFIAHALQDQPFVGAFDVIERFADGTADRSEFLAARKALRQATRGLKPSTPRPARDAAALFEHLTDDAMEGLTVALPNARPVARALGQDARPVQCGLIRDIFTSHFFPKVFDPAWRTPVIVALAHQLYEKRELPSGHLDTGRLAILADALEDTGCTSPDILEHCRSAGPHVLGCWVVDLVLDKA